MKSSNILLAIAIAVVGIFAGVVAYDYLSYMKTFHDRQLRDAAVDGCMQNSRYIWQIANGPEAGGRTDTQEEPNRYWYQLCMEEKGYTVYVEL